MVKRRFALLFLLNLLICGGLLAHYVSDAWCGVEVCVSAEIDTQETALHGGVDTPALLTAAPPLTTVSLIPLQYFSIQEYTRPPRHRPPDLT